MLEKPSSNSPESRRFAGAIAARAARKRNAKRHPRGVWSGLGMMGLVGWTVAVPTLLGAAAGMWLDARTQGTQSWTLALLVAGLVLGCLNAWRWVAKEEREMREAAEEDHE